MYLGVSVLEWHCDVVFSNFLVQDATVPIRCFRIKQFVLVVYVLQVPIRIYRSLRVAVADKFKRALFQRLGFLLGVVCPVRVRSAYQIYNMSCCSPYQISDLKLKCSVA